MKTGKEVAAYIRFWEDAAPGTVIYEINGIAAGDKWKKILVCLNGNKEAKPVTVGNGWQSFIINNQAVQSEKAVSEIILKPHSCSILFIQ
jgi:hypothetical protein